jgi:hypothetical protein
MSLPALRRSIEDADNAARAAEFCAAAKHLMLAKGNFQMAAGLARSGRATQSVVDMLERAPASPGDYQDGAWGAEIAAWRQISSGFVASLRSSGAFDALAVDALPLPTMCRIFAASTAAYGNEVSPLDVTPVTSMQFDTQLLPPIKTMALLAMSDDLAKHPGATEFISRELRTAVSKATDKAFIRVVTSGVSPLTASGVTASAIRYDIGRALDAMDSDASSRFYVISTAQTVKRLSTHSDGQGSPAFPMLGPTGGELLPGVRLLISSAVTQGQLIVVDATSLMVDVGAVDISDGRNAIMEMNTAPDSPPTSTTTLVSLWQAGLSAVKARRWFAVATVPKRKGCAIIGSADYGNSPP